MEPERARSEKPKAAPRLLFPREHGSWGMLLFPLVSAMILSRRWGWSLLAAGAAALARKSH